MNRDVPLAIASFAALLLSVVVALGVLCSDKDLQTPPAAAAVDRDLLDRSREAEPLDKKGSDFAFHWLLERIIQMDL
jgi:hypothetical protein